MFTVYQEDRFGFCEEGSFKATPLAHADSREIRLGSAAGRRLRDQGGEVDASARAWRCFANSTRIGPS